MWVYILVFIIGSAVGSFLNVVICRLPEKRSIVKGRSCCPYCQTAIKLRDLIPILSFFLLRGKCRQCRKKISWQYPIIELVSGLLFVFLAWQHQLPVNFDNAFFYRNIVFVAALIVIFVTDLRYYLIFQAVTIPVMFFALIANTFLYSYSGDWLTTLSYLVLAGAISGGFFFLQYYLSKGKWIGGGDVYLGLLMGFMLGVQNVLLALFIAYIIGAIVSVFLLLFRRKKLKSQVPFGVFLSLATFIALSWGDVILNWYFAFLLS